jgi:hypothetical protein
MRRDGGAVSGGRMRWHMVAEWREKKRGAVEWREGSNGEEQWSGRSRERSVVNWGLVAGRVWVDLFIHDMDFAGKAKK